MGNDDRSFCYNFNTEDCVDSTSILIFQFSESYNWIVIRGCKVGITVYIYVNQSNLTEERGSEARQGDSHQIKCHFFS
jgi:hypothetical protein